MTQTLPSDSGPARIGHPGGDKVKRGFFGAIALYVRQVIAELRRVTTPTRSELIRMTGIVLAFVAVMILLVTGMDLVFGSFTSLLFTGGPAEQ